MRARVACPHTCMHMLFTGWLKLVFAAIQISLNKCTFICDTFLLICFIVKIQDFFSVAYPFPGVAALMDLLYISRSSAVPLSRHLPSSSPPHPSPKISLVFRCFTGLSLFLLVLISRVFGAFSYVRNDSICSFLLLKLRSVPDVPPSSSAMHYGFKTTNL